MERIFRILEDTDTRATFFVIGWIARTYPDLVRRIAEKYEIGSHTMNHQLVWQQNRKAFKEDVSASVSLLEDINGKAVPSIISHEGVRIKEFPICTKEIGGRHIIFSGGGYFRLFPYWLIRKWAEEKSEYMISYIHPRDLDAGQPMIDELPWPRRFKSYVGSKK